MSPPSPCVFCAIVHGEHPAHLVLDDDAGVAFLDRRPLFTGHTLLVPRDHIDVLGDLPPDRSVPTSSWRSAWRSRWSRCSTAGGSFVALNNKVSQSVPHLHVHVVPRNRKDGLHGFFWPRTTYDSHDEMADYAARLRAGLEADRDR